MQRRLKRLVLLAAIIWIAVLPAFAQQPMHPNIPDQQLDITAFGAIGDGAYLNTKAIQDALDKASLKGGVVRIPKGIFLCGPLVVSAKTNLMLEQGAILRLRNDIDSFPAERERYLNFITIKKADDVKISGQGTIDGQGQVWWDRFTAKQLTYRRPQLLFAEGCSRLEIAGITFLNPPNTHVSLKDCSEVYIHDITINAPEKSRNTDGLNIAVRNCLIENCSIKTGDDNIAINFGGKPDATGRPECENIIIRHCKFGYGHGLSIGSFTSGGLNNLTVSDCDFDGTTAAIRIKSARGRGGLVTHVLYENIRISHSKWPIFISSYYPREPVNPEDDSTRQMTPATPVYRDIILRNVTVTNAAEAIKIWGLPGANIENLQFLNVNIEAKNGIQLFNAKSVHFENSRIKVSDGERVKTYQSTVTGL